MKTLLTAATILAIGVSAAHAKCGTSQLNGNWRLGQLGSATTQLLTVLNGNLSSGGTPIGTIAQTSSCKVTITAAVGIIKGWTEFIPTTSARRPKLMTLVNPSNEMAVLAHQ